jgi:hypothetical protein
MKICLCTAAVLAGLLVAPSLRADDAKTSPKIIWKRTVVDKRFRAEGVAVADVNKDGKMDVLAGDVWYEAPNWTEHRIRPGKSDYAKGMDNVYSNTFACWTDDLNGDGWQDLIVIGFPGAPCHWYENPQNKEGDWKEHFICKSACNETPQYLDLFGTGRRVLIMGYEEKQMAWFSPGKDPTQPWATHIIGGDGKKQVPGSAKYDHGLGVGDINGDGRLDVICNAGWYEQPEKLRDQLWRFHPAPLGPPCSDMYAIDVDGDGKADVVSSSAHNYGMWVHFQRSGGEDPTFVLEELFRQPKDVVKEASADKLTKEELALYAAVNKARGVQGKSPLNAVSALCATARNQAERLGNGKIDTEGTDNNITPTDAATQMKILAVASVKNQENAEPTAKALLEQADKIRLLPGYVIGIGCSKSHCVLVVADSGKFSLPSQTHAMNYVDIDGDGVKDLVTGRRWWAHGPKGDAGQNDPAVLYWFRGKRDSKGALTFTPQLIDDDSGVGTQFMIADINGDGIPDIIIANKRGVFVIEQIRRD